MKKSLRSVFGLLAALSLLIFASCEVGLGESVDLEAPEITITSPLPNAKVGCNVVMPNLSPTSVRDKYALYDGKICTGDEAAECRGCIERRINFAGYEVEIGRGDNIIWTLNHSKDNLS